MISPDLVERLDDVERDMVLRGDMLGPRLGAKVTAILMADYFRIQELERQLGEAQDNYQRAHSRAAEAIRLGNALQAEAARLREALEQPSEETLLAIVRHMDSFATIGASRFAPRPSTAGWADYSKVEQDAARLAAVAVARSIQPKAGTNNAG